MIGKFGARDGDLSLSVSGHGVHSAPSVKNSIAKPLVAPRRLTELSVLPTTSGTHPFSLGGRNGDIVTSLRDSSALLPDAPSKAHFTCAVAGDEELPSLPTPAIDIIGWRIVAVQGVPTRTSPELLRALTRASKAGVPYGISVCPAVEHVAAAQGRPNKTRTRRVVDSVRKLQRQKQQEQEEAARVAAEAKAARAKSKALQKAKAKRAKERKLQAQQAAKLKAQKQLQEEKDARRMQEQRDLKIILEERKKELQRIQDAGEARRRKETEELEAAAARKAAQESAARARRLELEQERRKCEQTARQKREAEEAAEAAKQEHRRQEAEAAERVRQAKRKQVMEEERRRKKEQKAKEAAVAAEAEAAAAAAKAKEKEKEKEKEALPPPGKPPTKKLKTTGALRELPPKARVADPQASLLKAMTKGFIDAPNGNDTSTTKCGPCGKCDGDHHADDCPYYKKARPKHKDAWDNYRRKDTDTTPNAAPFLLRGARVVPQPGDGSCLFHSLCFGLSKGLEASGLRRELANFVQMNPSLLISGTPLCDWVLWDSGLTPERYAKRMRASAHWGGAIEIACCAALHGCNVHVYEVCGAGHKRISMFDCPEDIARTTNAMPPKTKTVHLVYGGRVHYDALRPRT